MMGEKSVSTPAIRDSSDTDHDTPREGLGNFADRLTGKKNPSDLGDIVNGQIPP